MSMTSKFLSAILNHLRHSSRKDFLDPHQHRAFLEESAGHFRQDPAVLMEKFSIGHIPAAWLTPQNGPPFPPQPHRRVILYLHGGGFVAGSINTHRDLASRIAKSANQKILIIDYRLAPEHPFPAGLEDALSAYKWLADRYYPYHQISIVGDSAGGNLVLSLMLRLKELGIPLPSKAVLISPWLQLNNGCRLDISGETDEKDPMLSFNALDETANIYADLSHKIHGEVCGKNPSTESAPNHGRQKAMDRNRNLNDPLLSPINGDFTGLPPLMIQVGTHEILLEDSKIMTQKAQAAKVDVTLEVWEEMFHVWHYFARYLKEGQNAIDSIGKWLSAD